LAPAGPAGLGNPAACPLRFQPLYPLFFSLIGFADHYLEVELLPLVIHQQQPVLRAEQFGTL